MMTADIVNLRTARKRKARVERERIAEQNRALFGRTRLERAREEAEANRARRTLDGHERDDRSAD